MSRRWQAVLIKPRLRKNTVFRQEALSVEKGRRWHRVRRPPRFNHRLTCRVPCPVLPRPGLGLRPRAGFGGAAGNPQKIARFGVTFFFFALVWFGLFFALLCFALQYRQLQTSLAEEIALHWKRKVPSMLQSLLAGASQGHQQFYWLLQQASLTAWSKFPRQPH